MDDFTTQHLQVYADRTIGQDEPENYEFVFWVHSLDADDLEYYCQHGWPVALSQFRSVTGRSAF